MEGHRCPREVKGQRVQNDENGTQHRASLEREKSRNNRPIQPAQTVYTDGWLAGGRGHTEACLSGRGLEQEVGGAYLAVGYMFDIDLDEPLVALLVQLPGLVVAKGAWCVVGLVLVGGGRRPA